MSDLRTAWTEVANKLEGLGQHLKERAIEAKESTSGEKEARDHAAKDFAASVQNAFAAVEDTVTDPETRRQAGEVGRSVVAALATTLANWLSRASANPPVSEGDGCSGIVLFRT